MKSRIPVIAIAFAALLGCDQKAGVPAVELNRSVESIRASELSEERQEASAWDKLGIARAQTIGAPKGVDHRIALFDGAGQQIGTVDIEEGTGDSGPYEQRITTSVRSETVVMEIGQAAGFRLSHPASGRTGAITADVENKQLVADATAEVLEQEFKDLISTGTMAHTSIFRRLIETDAEVEKKNEACPVGDSNSRTDALTVGCQGSWHMGMALAASKFQCCYIVGNEVANKCTNPYCIGCCEKGPCENWWCRMGDGICLCSQSGRSCYPHY